MDAMCIIRSIVLALLLFLHALFSCNGSPLAANDFITASITRKLAFPDFKDDEKTGAITLLGSASVDKHSGELRIPGVSANGSSTHDHALANRAGKALYTFPFRMLDPKTNATSSFHTTFAFRIDKVSTAEAESNDSSYGDGGLTFLIVPDDLTVGRSGGWLGMLNDACDETYQPFAVEFDTFKNPEFQDPSDEHIGVNFGNIVSNQTADPSAAGVSFRDGSTVQAWISYDSTKQLVDVRISKEGSSKPSRPLISASVDLSKIFKEYMFVGFSGATGSSTAGQVHSIQSWHFSSDSTGILRFPKDQTCAPNLIPSVIMINKRKSANAFIIFCLVMLIVFLAVLNVACGSRKRGKRFLAKGIRPRSLHRLRSFSVEEILEATKLFSEGEVLGKGNRGTFFKGVLADGSQTAIKRCSPRYLSNSCLDQRRVVKEVRILSHLRHPNLVPLRGWCLEKGELLLLYEYMPNGSLDKWMLSQGSALPWVRLFQAIKEIATALAFLHSGTEKAFFHKNLKMSNVFLDSNFRARLGDFGIDSINIASLQASSCCCSKHGSIARSKETLREMDVYNFGVLMLEIVSGRASGDVVEWVWKLHEEGRLMEALNEEEVYVRGSYYKWEVEAMRVLRAGLLCTHEDPHTKPSMDVVAKFLRGEALLPEVPLSRKIMVNIFAGLHESPHQTPHQEQPTCIALASCISLAQPT